jgi:non-specific serine/threonine protein kinase
LLDRDDVRLVTLTGPGGTGKTRLALHVAADRAGNFAGGIAWVPLATVPDAGAVVPFIARTLGVQAGGDVRPLDRLIASLRRQSEALLVLDNFEHVDAAAPSVAELLAACPGLKLLATSRSPLRIAAERVFPVPPLDVPAPGARMEPDRVAQSAAGSLFVTRALAASPGFALTETNAPVIAEICRRLDGLPLAIELAAARIAHLAPEVLLARLDTRLPLLTRGAADLPPRHQTMRNAIAWSYDLLSPEEQLLFRQISVFAGGFTLEAAEAIAEQGDRGTGGQGDRDFSFACPPVPLSPSVLDVLASLVDKSLVRFSGGTGAVGGKNRYDCLETVREFAYERLIAHGEENATRNRHADWCASLLEAAEPAFQSGRDETVWMARLDDEWPNVRASLGWLLANGDATRLLRLVSPLDDYWISRSHHAEVRLWLEAALSDAPDAPPQVRVAALHVLVVVASMLDDQLTAFARAEEALAVACALDDPFVQGRAHFYMGCAWELRGDGARSAAHFEAAMPLLRDAGTPHWAALAMGELGDKRVWIGDAVAAVPLLDDAIDRHRRLGYAFGLAMSLGQRAYAALALGDNALAARRFAESIDAAREIAADRIVLGAAAGLAGVALARGDAALAGRLFAAVESERKATGIGRIAHALHAERIASAMRNWVGERVPEDALAAGQTPPLERLIDEVLAGAAARPASTEAPASSTLTPREREVLQLLAVGLSDREIADALFIGERTVNTHVGRIYAKLGVRNRAAAVAAAIAAGLVDPESVGTNPA